MYAFIDQPVERLCNGGRFVLWAMRGWARAKGLGNCPPAALVDGFIGLGAGDALSQFHAAMQLVDGHSASALTPCPVGYEVIGESEAILLRLWRDVAGGRTAAACATLSLVVTDKRASAVAKAMADAARSLAAAGFDLSELSTQTLKEEK